MASTKIEFNIHWGRYDIERTLSLAERYFGGLERQIPQIQADEIDAVRNPDHELDHDEERDLVNYTEQVMEEEFIPALRYSYVVFFHTLLEKNLRYFCERIRSEGNLPLSLSELSGSDIDRAKTFLTKLAKIPVTEFEEWAPLQGYQKVRDCIVHAHGDIFKNRHEAALRAIAGMNIGLSITDGNRLLVSDAFCKNHLRLIRGLFQKLFKVADWKNAWISESSKPSADVPQEE